MDEHETRHIQIDPSEVQWARNRPVEHRTPRPRVGDAVLYRHQEWDTQLYTAEVVEFRDTDDVGDPLMWRYVIDADRFGRRPFVDGAGRNLMELVDDPWPVVRLDTPWGLIDTREARVRGSAGWLPLDWRARWRPRPSLGGLMAQQVRPRWPQVRPRPPRPGDQRRGDPRRRG